MSGRTGYSAPSPRCFLILVVSLLETFLFVPVVCEQKCDLAGTSSKSPQCSLSSLKLYISIENCSAVFKETINISSTYAGNFSRRVELIPGTKQEIFDGIATVNSQWYRSFSSNDTFNVELNESDETTTIFLQYGVKNAALRGWGYESRPVLSRLTRHLATLRWRYSFGSDINSSIDKVNVIVNSSRRQSFLSWERGKLDPEDDDTNYLPSILSKDFENQMIPFDLVVYMNNTDICPRKVKYFQQSSSIWESPVISVIGLLSLIAWILFVWPRRKHSSRTGRPITSRPYAPHTENIPLQQTHRRPV